MDEPATFGGCEVQRLVKHPDDRFVLMSEEVLTDHQKRRIREEWAKFWAAGTDPVSPPPPILILEGFRLSAVFVDDIAAVPLGSVA